MLENDELIELNEQLLKACLIGTASKVESLLKGKADPNYVPIEILENKAAVKFPPLYQSAFSKADPVLKTELLLNFQANPEFKNVGGNSLLHNVVELDGDYISLITRKLCKVKKEGFTQNHYGETPFHRASSPETLEELCKVSSPEELNLKNKSGDTALDLAILNDFAHIPILLRYGADPLILDKKGESALTKMYQRLKFYEKKFDPLQQEDTEDTVDNYLNYEEKKYYKIVQDSEDKKDYEILKDSIAHIANKVLKDGQSLSAHGILDEQLELLVAAGTQLAPTFQNQDLMHTANLEYDIIDYGWDATQSLADAAESGAQMVEQIIEMKTMGEE